MQEIILNLDEMEDVRKIIEESIAENPPFSMKEGGLIRDGYNDELDQLRNIRRDGKSFIASMLPYIPF